MSNLFEADVDIDVSPKVDKDRFGVRAIIFDENKCAIVAHPSGYYMDGMPVDPETGMAAIDYKDAAARGFFKVDLLTNSVYDRFDNKQQVIDALHMEPDWDRLEDEEFVAGLPHLAAHYQLIMRLQPRSLDDLADILALIRPGKQHLIDDYARDKENTRANLYRKPKHGMWFKKSHSYAYAAMVVCAMNRQEKALVEF